MRLAIGILLCLFFACSSDHSSEKKKIEKEIAESDSALPVFYKGVLEGSRSRVLGEILAEKIWRQKKNIYFTLVSLKQIAAKEFGAVYITQYKVTQTSTDRRWVYGDSVSCGEWDVGISYDLDSLIVEDMNGDGSKDITIIYSLDCHADVSPLARHLVVLDTAGKTILKLNGWTKDPGTPEDISNQDLQSNSPSQEGIIDNYKELTKLDSSTQKRLITLWREALKNDFKKQSIK